MVDDSAVELASACPKRKMQVALQRKRSSVPYPKMYEEADNSVFNCYQRAHHNTLGSYPAFLTLLLIAGLAYPITASAVGTLEDEREFGASVTLGMEWSLMSSWQELRRMKENLELPSHLGWNGVS